MVKSELLRLSEQDTEGSGVDLTPLITNSVSNVISYVALGQRFHHADREFGALLDPMARGLEIIANRYPRG